MSRLDRARCEGEAPGCSLQPPAEYRYLGAGKLAECQKRGGQAADTLQVPHEVDASHRRRSARAHHRAGVEIHTRSKHVVAVRKDKPAAFICVGVQQLERRARELRDRERRGIVADELSIALAVFVERQAPHLQTLRKRHGRVSTFVC